MKKFFRRQKWGQNEKLSGTYIISYPKAGRTWLRLMIGKYLCDLLGRPDTDALKLEGLSSAAGLPTINMSHNGSNLARDAEIAELSTNKECFRDSRVLLLTRSLPDLMVSAYFQTTRRVVKNGTPLFVGSISEFLRHPRLGAMKAVAFYRSWQNCQHQPRSFFHLSYKQLSEDPGRELERVLDFLGLELIDRRLLQNSVVFAQFENMRRLEKADHFKDASMRPGDMNDPESFKTRRGRVGGYGEYLSASDLEYLNELVRLENCSFLM